MLKVPKNIHTQYLKCVWGAFFGTKEWSMFPFPVFTKYSWKGFKECLKVTLMYIKYFFNIRYDVIIALLKGTYIPYSGIDKELLQSIKDVNTKYAESTRDS